MLSTSPIRNEKADELLRASRSARDSSAATMACLALLLRRLSLFDETVVALMRIRCTCMEELNEGGLRQTKDLSETMTKREESKNEST